MPAHAPGRQFRVTRLLRLAGPLAVAVAAGVFSAFYLAPGVDTASMTRGPLGPVVWPKAMLACLLASAAVVFLVRLWQFAKGVPDDVDGGKGEYHEGRGAAAIAVLLAYAWALPIAGFAFSTAVFIAAVLLLGGVRRPRTVVLTAGIGTVALLYVFVKVSLMPLDRGKGAFETATITLYRLLGIY
ncbi:MAG: tripartite tricarboxylate transporter TctB family protein [Betaproteobacteria bacterium]|nr:tripartite tricarboxylate transporter TctB family protein [Betaproteobacteria bacterium]MBM3383564.1 tripartite tricarboxylate transporter TctB family protein [Betaproteobacteria bacterium]